MRRRIYAVFAALLLCVLMVGVVSAADVNDEGGLIAAITAGNSVTLTADVELTNTLTISDSSVTIDLNGHNLTTPGVVGTAESQYLLSKQVLKISGTADVVIQGPGFVYSGTIINSTSTSEVNTISVENSASLTIQDETTVAGAEAVNSRYGGNALYMTSSGALIINEATLSGGNALKDGDQPKGNFKNDAGAGVALSVYSGSDDTSIKIANSTISGGNGLYANYQTAYISGGENFAKGNKAISFGGSGQYLAEIIDSIVKGGDSQLYNAGNALSTYKCQLSIIHSQVKGGNALGLGASDNHGIGGYAMDVSRNQNGNITIQQSEIIGGDAGNSWIGYGIEMFTSGSTSAACPYLTISDSTISGGGVTEGCRGGDMGHALYVNSGDFDQNLGRISISNSTFTAHPNAYLNGAAIVASPGIGDNIIYHVIDLMVEGEGTIFTAEGEVTSPSVMVQKNEDITFTFRPEVGFATPSILIDGESKGIYDEYTLTDVQADSHLKAVFLFLDWDGEGTVDDPFLISDLNYLKAMRDNVNYGGSINDVPAAEASYELIDNIDLGGNDGTQWIPIGTDGKGKTSASEKKFTGTFEGNGFTISNLNITCGITGTSGTIGYLDADNSYYEAGLFGHVEDAAIKNLTLENVTIMNSMVNLANVKTERRGNQGTGSLIGHATGDLTLENITITGDVKIDAMYKVGGVLGAHQSGNPSTYENIIINVSDESYIHSSDAAYGDTNNLGGVVGFVTGTTLTLSNCSSDIHLITGWTVGGLVGGFAGSGNTLTIQSSQVYSTFTNEDHNGDYGGFAYPDGGFLGMATSGTDSVTCKDCYFFGNFDTPGSRGDYFYGWDFTTEVSLPAEACYYANDLSKATVSNVVGAKSIISGPATVTQDVPVIFSINLPEGTVVDSYQWKVNDVLIAGYTGKQFEYTFTESGNAEVRVVLNIDGKTPSCSYPVTIQAKKAVPPVEDQKPATLTPVGNVPVSAVNFSSSDAPSGVTVTVEDKTTEKQVEYQAKIPSGEVVQVLNFTVTGITDPSNLQDMAVVKFSLTLPNELAENEKIVVYRFSEGIEAMPLETTYVLNVSAPSYTYDCTALTPGFSDLVPTIVSTPEADDKYAIISLNAFVDENSNYGIISGEDLVVPVNLTLTAGEISAWTITTTVANATTGAAVTDLTYAYSADTTVQYANIEIVSPETFEMGGRTYGTSIPALFTVTLGNTAVLTKEDVYTVTITIAGSLSQEGGTYITYPTKTLSFRLVTTDWLVDSGSNFYNSTCTAHVDKFENNQWYLNTPAIGTMIVRPIDYTSSGTDLWPTVTRNAHALAAKATTNLTGVTILKTTGTYDPASPMALAWESTAAGTTATITDDGHITLTTADADHDATYFKIIFTGRKVGDVVDGAGDTGNVNIYDVDMIAHAAVSVTQATLYISPDNMLYADIDHDGQISLNDLFTVFDYYRGYVPSHGLPDSAYVA